MSTEVAGLIAEIATSVGRTANTNAKLSLSTKDAISKISSTGAPFAPQLLSEYFAVFETIHSRKRKEEGLYWGLPALNASESLASKEHQTRNSLDFNVASKGIEFLNDGDYLKWSSGFVPIAAQETSYYVVYCGDDGPNQGSVWVYDSDIGGEQVAESLNELLSALLRSLTFQERPSFEFVVRQPTDDLSLKWETVAPDQSI